MREFFIRGGPLMWPLLACSLVSLAVVLERALFWIRLHLAGRDKLADRALALAEGRDYEQALAALRSGRDPVSRVLAAGLRRRDEGMTERMTVAAEVEMARMRRSMSVLDTIVTIAPLLGILGTVLGIIQAFNMLSGGELQQPKSVVGGLAQALITTAAGLIIAIATVIPFNYFRARIVAETKRMENAATLLELVCRKAREPAHAA